MLYFDKNHIHTVFYVLVFVNNVSFMDLTILTISGYLGKTHGTETTIY